MERDATTTALVERKRYDDMKAHAIAPGIWWVGFLDTAIGCSQNPFLLVDENEAVLINPGSRSEEHYRIIRNKVASVIAPSRIVHIVLLHHDPDRCAATPLFESQADRNVRIYAPAQVARSIKYYGCKHPIIALDGGDSIILKSGRTLDYYATPNLSHAGSGLLYHKPSGTLFSGNIFNCPTTEWNLYAPGDAWTSLAPHDAATPGSRKAFHHALNKIERISPERICPQRGPIIEEDIDKYISAAREIDFGE